VRYFGDGAEVPQLTSGKVDKVTLRSMLADPTHGSKDVS
jgi:hypothetical protein